jgi:hypothetical protein
MTSSVPTTQRPSDHQLQTAVTTALLHRLREAGAELDAIGAIGEPLLWATQCSLDAAILLLHAFVRSLTESGQDHEALLEAIAAARASVVAATFAARTTDTARPRVLWTRRSPDE